MQNSLYFDPNVFDEITEHLFVGGAEAAKNDYGFSMVVNCTRNTDITFPTECKHCVRIEIDDSPKDYDKLFRCIEESRVLDEIHSVLQKGEKVLVHCFTGAQRSCAVVACYLLKYHAMTVKGVIEYIKNKRSIAFFGDVHFIRAMEECFSKYRNVVR
jgi:protein-tyrosine phosphatase